MNISLYKREHTPDFVVGTGKIHIDDVKRLADNNGLIYLDLLKSSGLHDRSCGYYLKISEYYWNKNNANAEEPFK